MATWLGAQHACLLGSMPDSSRLAPVSRRGTAWCVAHPGGQPRAATGGAPDGNQNARKHGLYAAYVPVVELKQALVLPPGDLRLEIAVVRQVR